MYILNVYFRKAVYCTHQLEARFASLPEKAHCNTRRKKKEEAKIYFKSKKQELKWS